VVGFRCRGDGFGRARRERAAPGPERRGAGAGACYALAARHGRRRLLCPCGADGAPLAAAPAPALPAVRAPPQDKAREFLSSVGQSKQILYRLFMDATLMGDFKGKLQTTQVRGRGWRRNGRAGGARLQARHRAPAAARLACPLVQSTWFILYPKPFTPPFSGSSPFCPPPSPLHLPAPTTLVLSLRAPPFLPPPPPRAWSPRCTPR
jgi:hypothetical protein